MKPIIKITDFYDELRPYNEKEAGEAIHRITENPVFYKIILFFFPEYTKEDFKNLIQSVHSVKDFQANVMSKILNKILETSSKGLTYSGLENLDPKKHYVFISNHRDIVLDAAIFEEIFYRENFPTTEITFGSNLMEDRFIYDIGKINKMFKVYRKGNPKELLKKTIQLSEYIRYTIFNKRQSIWMAQRGGRTKDGNDKTQTGIIKMLNFSGEKHFIDNIRELNIVPLSISYEFEPNDHFKVNELYHTVNGKYEKKPKEDINSIVDGITCQKGKIHLSFCPELNTRLSEIESISKTNEKVVKTSQIIDEEIYKNYRLHPNNFIAFDILNNEARYTERYSQEMKTGFIDYMEKKLTRIKLKNDRAKILFLNIYANPVINYERTLKPNN
jgi:hypothetical protein